MRGYDSAWCGRFPALFASLASLCHVRGQEPPPAALNNTDMTHTSPPPIALQIYSVRDDAARDLAAVLEAVARMGYVGVEFAGFYGNDAPTVKRLLDANNLQVAGAHVGIEALLGDELEKTVAFHREIGNRFLIVPGLPPSYRDSLDAWHGTAQLLSDISTRLAPHGMRTGYHNHTVEFAPMNAGESLPWDAFFGTADPRVVMQFDTGNALHGGKDALPFLQAYPGRAATVHLKEYAAANPDALLGEGDVPFKAILAELARQNATEWLIVEQESGAYPPMECVERSLRNLEVILEQA